MRSAAAAAVYPVRTVNPALQAFLKMLFILSVLALCLAGYFMATLYYASVLDDRILRGMDEHAVEQICWLGTRRETPLAQTTAAATAELPAAYGKIVVYRIGGFHPIEVVYSTEGKVLATLPAYE